MSIQFHQNARLTQSVTNQELAQAYNFNRHTVVEWYQREGTGDASHRPQQLR